MKLSLKAGTTSKSVAIFIQNNSVTTGAGLTGLVYNTSSLTAYYLREGGTATSITLATLAAANSAFSSGGFKEIDATNMPGLYRLDIPDAAIASSAKWVVIMLKGATNMAPVVLEIELTAWDNQDTVRGGLTALPNAAAEASGGLFTRGTGAGQINQDGNGRIDVNAVRMGGTALTARDIGASVLLSSGTGTGQISLSSGAVTAGTVSDKTGYSLSQSFPTNFSSLSISAAGLVDILQTAADKVWGTTTRRLSDGTNIVLAKGTGITGFNDLSAAQVNAEADTALSDAGVTTTVTGRIDAAISTRLASASYTAPDNTSITAIKNKTDSLTFTVAGQVDANIQYVNDVQVNGTGASGDEWGP